MKLKDGLYLVRKDELIDFNKKFKLNEDELFYRLSNRYEDSMVIKIDENSRYYSFMPLADVPLSAYKETRKWIKKLKEWRQL